MQRKISKSFIKTLHIITALCIGLFLKACTHKSNAETEKTVVELVSFQEEEETVEPPPPGYISHFPTIHEWLKEICKNERLNSPVDTFNFGLFENEDETYTLFLAGLTTNKNGTYARTTISFQPTHMYYLLPEAYKGLKREQVWEKIEADILAFTKTETFEKSFMAKANTVTTEYNGKTIWAR